MVDLKSHEFAALALSYYEQYIYDSYLLIQLLAKVSVVWGLKMAICKIIQIIMIIN